jgi:hypothetical protein
MNSKVRYMYVRDANWDPVGCIAITVNRSQYRVVYGLSVRNPADAIDTLNRRVKFDRKAAQSLALQRLLENPQHSYISKSATQHEISGAVMQGIIASGSAPSRAVRFAKNWLQMAAIMYA